MNIGRFLSCSPCIAASLNHRCHATFTFSFTLEGQLDVDDALNLIFLIQYVAQNDLLMISSCATELFSPRVCRVVHRALLHDRRKQSHRLPEGLQHQPLPVCRPIQGPRGPGRRSALKTRWRCTTAVACEHLWPDMRPPLSLSLSFLLFLLCRHSSGHHVHSREDDGSLGDSVARRLRRRRRPLLRWVRANLQGPRTGQVLWAWEGPWEQASGSCTVYNLWPFTPSQCQCNYCINKIKSENEEKKIEQKKTQFSFPFPAFPTLKVYCVIFGVIYDSYIGKSFTYCS